jgi:hypothetical protein
MIDTRTETTITLPQAAAEQPCRREGKKVSTITLWRWATKGCRGIILETLQTPSGRVTSREAIQRFFEALTESHQVSSGPATSAPLRGRRSPSRRQRDSERAERELVERGA